MRHHLFRRLDQPPAPLALALLALLALNLGMYSWLAPDRPAAPAEAPVAEAPAAEAPAAEAAPPPLNVPWPSGGATVFRADWGRGIAEEGWRVLSGDWAVEGDSVVQRNPAGHDYTIVHSGSYTNVLIQVTLTHRQGSGGGLLFNMPSPDRQAGAHLVRYDDAGKALFWGYFNAEGGFVGQGYANGPAPGTAPHRIEILSGAESYAIRLDGVTIAADVPLFSTSGGIALTSSQSVVAFSDLALTEVGAEAPPADALAGMSVLSGDWAAEDGVIVQRAGEATDYLNATGAAAERYQLDLAIQFPAGAPADAGGGVIFHMPARDSLQGAHMVRLANRGAAVFWGRYDASGTFIGEGSADLGAPTEGVRRLAVAVRGDSFDITVDGRLIAGAIPLQRGDGWISLLSFRGPVRFTTVELRLGEAPR